MSIMEYESSVNDFDEWLISIKKLRNEVIGSNKRKEKAVHIVLKLIEFLKGDETPLELKLESAIVLGSLAKGSSDLVQQLVTFGILAALIKNLQNESIKLIEACLRCLRSIVSKSEEAKKFLYQDSSMMPQLLSLLNRSSCCQECIANFFFYSCKTAEQQLLLYKSKAVPKLITLLSSNSQEIKISSLKCLIVFCYKNKEVSNEVAHSLIEKKTVLNYLLQLQQRDQTIEMQISAAKCLANIFRTGTLNSSDNQISQKVLSTLVNMCQPDKAWEHRREGALTLAYLIEDDITLQLRAAISGQILNALNDFFNYPGSPIDISLMPTERDDILLGNDLRHAAFNAYASLAANNEDVRKKIIESGSILQHVINGLSDPIMKVQYSSINCLLSLSRSVQQLRIVFLDKKIWKPIVEILLNSNEEMLLIQCTAVLCNLLLEFSPSKESILSEGNQPEKKSPLISKLLNLTRSDNAQIRTNAIWALMNMTFESSRSCKETLLKTMQNDDIFHLLRGSNNVIVAKTLATLRNLLGTDTSIDYVMGIIGQQIMESVILVLEGDNPLGDKEEALCILINISNGEIAKNLIMDNSDVLRKIMTYLLHENTELQLSALSCVYNLIKNTHAGLEQRKQTFREMQLERVLTDLTEKNIHSKLKIRIKETLEELKNSS